MIAIRDHYYALKRAFNLLFQGHFSYYFIPGILIAVFFYAYLFIIENIAGFFGLIAHTPWVGLYMEPAVNSVFEWVNSLSLFIYQFTIITLLSPFHTMLSQKVETFETGQKFSPNWFKFINDLLRTIGVIIVGGVIYFIIYMLWSIFARLLDISFLSPIVSMVLVSFFTGFNSYDYSLERHNIGILTSWKFAFKHPLQLILTVGIFTLLLFIPLFGVVIAPVLLTMVGTVNYLKIAEKANN